MAGYFAGFKATTTVYAYINNNTAGAHSCYHFFGYQNGRTAKFAANCTYSHFAGF